MGLDMYLYAVPKIDGMSFTDILFADASLSKLKSEEPEIYKKLEPHIKEFEEFGKTYRGLAIEVAYWRKANQIHNWFVKNVQNGNDDCKPYEVSKARLQLLYQHCYEVLLKNNGTELLPTKTGFYFGSTEYDRYYYIEIENTKNIIGDILKLYDFDHYYLIYNSLW